MDPYAWSEYTSAMCGLPLSQPRYLVDIRFGLGRK